jgi:guanylate kinase
VHGNYYGTSRVAVADRLSRGEDIVLDIDVQGASIIADDTTIDAVSVFVAPPSLTELEQRLRGRGTDSDEVIDVRLQNAAKELAAVSAYQYLVINDKLEDAVLVMQSIIIAERSRARRHPSGTPVDLGLVT